MRFLFLLVLFLPTRAFASVYMSELLWAGSDVSTADEWIELTADQETSLAGWRVMLVETDLTEREIVRFASGALLHAQQYIIVANYSAAQSRLAAEPALVTTAMSLPNSHLWLRLYNDEGTIIDEVMSDSSAPLAGFSTSENGMRASMERIRFDLPGDDPAAWQSASMSLGLDPEAHVLATPGFAAVLNMASSSSSSENSAPQKTPRALLEELLPDPPGTDRDGEWIEILNADEEPLNVAELSLRVGSKTVPLAFEITLQPGERTSLPTGPLIALPNGGTTVSLLFQDHVLDSLTYPALPSGISYGKKAGGDIGPICLPSPGTEGVEGDPEIRIDVQNGNLSGIEKTSVNFTSMIAMPPPFTCHWDFGNGEVSESCNPGSQTFDDPGFYLVKLTVTNYCSTTLTQEKTVQVFTKKETATSSSSSSSESSKIEIEKAPIVTDPAWAFVTLSEVYAHPQKDASDLLGQEWLRVTNQGEVSVDLEGWILDDDPKGSRPFVIGSGIVLAPKSSYIFSKAQSKLTLNDAGETLRLISPDGMERSRVTFPKLKTGESYVFQNSTWCITATPSIAGEPLCKTKDAKTPPKMTVKTPKMTKKTSSSPQISQKGILDYLTTKYVYTAQGSSQPEVTGSSATVFTFENEAFRPQFPPHDSDLNYMAQIRAEMAILGLVFAVIFGGLILQKYWFKPVLTHAIDKN